MLVIPKCNLQEIKVSRKKGPFSSLQIKYYQDILCNNNITSKPNNETGKLIVYTVMIDATFQCGEQWYIFNKEILMLTSNSLCIKP